MGTMGRKGESRPARSVSFPPILPHMFRNTLVVWQEGSMTAFYDNTTLVVATILLFALIVQRACRHGFLLTDVIAAAAALSGGMAALQAASIRCRR